MPSYKVCEKIHPYLINGKCRYCEKWVRRGVCLEEFPEDAAAPAQWDIERLKQIPGDETIEDSLLLALFEDCEIGACLPYFETLVTAPVPRSPLDPAPEICWRGSNMSEEEIEICTDYLDLMPESFAARLFLLGCYFSEACEPEGSLRHAELVYWIIEHHPTSSICRNAYASIPVPGAAFAKGRDKWMRQVEVNPDNATILGHAAQYLLIYDRRKAEELLLKTRSLEPEQRTWNKQLSLLYSLDARVGEGEAKRAAAAKALQYGELALHANLDPIEEIIVAKATQEGEANAPEVMNQIHRLWDLPQLARMAMDAGEHEWARNYAHEILNQDIESPAYSNYEDHYHLAKTILGRLALQSGDINQAKQYLQESAECGFCAFGPDLSLANELLNQGERDAVREYLKTCLEQWPSGTEDVSQWIAELDAERIPKLESRR